MALFLDDWLQIPERLPTVIQIPPPSNPMNSSIKMIKFKIKRIMKLQSVICLQIQFCCCALLVCLTVPACGSFPYRQPSPRLKWSPRGLGSSERAEMMDYQVGPTPPHYNPVCITVLSSFVFSRHHPFLGDGGSASSLLPQQIQAKSRSEICSKTGRDVMLRA